jgi:hypothetical protein
LGDAIRSSAGTTPTEESAGDAGLLINLTKGGTDYYFAATLVQSGPIAAIQLSPGDHISVLPWTKTDLFRGLMPTANVLPQVDPGDPEKSDDVVKSLLVWSIKLTRKQPPAKKESEILQAKDLNSAAQLLCLEFTEHTAFETPRSLLKIADDKEVTKEDLRKWAEQADTGYIAVLRKESKERADRVANKKYEVDWAYLKALYGIKPDELQPRNIDVKLITEAGPVKFPPSYAEVKWPPRFKSTFHPSLRQFEAHSTLGTGAVIVVHRVVDGRPSQFVLARNWDQPQGALVGTDITVGQQIVRDMLVFDGDVIEIMDPAQMPIVSSSLLAPMLKAALDLRSGVPLPRLSSSRLAGSGSPSGIGVGTSLLPRNIGLGGSILPTISTDRSKCFEHSCGVNAK